MNSKLDQLPSEIVVDRTFIPTTHRFLISSQDFIFILEDGNLDLFCTSIEQRTPELTNAIQNNLNGIASFPGSILAGPFQYIASFKAGESLFPFPENSSDSFYCFVAIARGNCNVARISIEKLRQLLSSNSALHSWILFHMQEWMKRLPLAYEDFPPNSAPINLNRNERYQLDSGALFMSTHSKDVEEVQDVLWLNVHQGKVCEWGLPQLTVENGAILFPFRSLVWFQCLEQATVEVIPMNGISLLDDRSWKGFYVYQSHFIHLLHIIAKRESAERLEEQELRIQRDHQLLTQSIQDLQTILNPESAKIAGSEKDHLFRVCQLIGNRLGLTFSRPRVWTGPSVEERLKTLCMHSQVYYRRIRLFGHWWENQAIPLVAFYQKERRPIALIPHPTLGYQLVDPAEGKISPLTGKKVSQISDVGYMFYRQLPQGPLSLNNIASFSFWKRGRDWMAFIFLVLCGTLASLSYPIITQFLFDVVIPNRNEFLLFEIALGALLISIATLAFNFGRESIILRLESLSDHDLEMALWQRLVNLPVRFFRNHSIYDLFTFTSSVSAIRQVLTSHVIHIFLNGAFAILYFFLMFYYSAILASVGVAIIAIQFLAIAIPLYFGIQYSRQLLDRQIQANNKMLEMVQALTKVRMAGVENRMFNRWGQTFTKMQQMDLKILLLQMRTGVFNVFWANASTWVIYFVVILIVMSQSTHDSYMGLTLGGFMAFLSVFGLFSSALLQIGATLLNVIKIVPLWEKTKSFAQAEVENISTKTDPGILQGEIRIDHLTFSYQSDRPPVIHDVSLMIHPGESVAFVGPSGGGKTTLIRLLLGFEHSDQGSIYYDNKDLRGLNLQALRRQLGVVLQSGAIFDGTIRDNINGGRHYSIDEIKTALELCGASFFIQDLPMGIHTVLTNGGASLSGGQRQLILLARAIVGKPKILILDEATSSLDNQKQMIVHEHLSRLPMTRIIVAQRLDALRHVDRIYVIEKGRIVDQGTFAELSKRTGFFSDLLARQMISP